MYKARDTHLDRFVAIKVLPHDAVADPGRNQRFTQEAKAASTLNHPGIVTRSGHGLTVSTDRKTILYSGTKPTDGSDLVLLRDFR